MVQFGNIRLNAGNTESEFISHLHKIFYSAKKGLNTKKNHFFSILAHYDTPSLYLYLEKNYLGDILFSIHTCTHFLNMIRSDVFIIFHHLVDNTVRS